MPVEKKYKNKPSVRKGKVGKTIIYELNGKRVSRVVGKIGSRTINQMTAQQSLAVTSKFFSPIIDFINIGFMAAAKKAKKSAQSVAISLNYDCATGMYPEVYFDCTKAIVSKGSVFKPSGPEVRFIGGALEFTWLNDLDCPSARASDHVMLLAYYPEVNNAVFVLSGEKRDKFKAVLKLPNIRDVTRVETYIAFMATNHKNVSDSVYTGPIFI